MVDVADTRSRYQQVAGFLDERGRRLFAANEALASGHGGVSTVSIATGIARSTINRGIKELQAGRNEIGGRVRRPGGGRKSAVAHQPDLPAALEALIEDAIRGDPMTPLRWVSRSLRNLVRALGAQGYRVSQRVVANLLRDLNYSCQANRKTREGANHPDRDAQFAHINATVKAAITARQPAISVDTKKKELVGDFKNAGHELRRQRDPEPVRVHDFEVPELGKVAPYGVYDIAANHGWVSVGVDADTAGFAVESIRRWWYRLGKARYPDAKRLVVTADCGGSNGVRVRLWKRELQRFANETGLAVNVTHLPPGTSKWNKIGVSRTHLQRKEVWSYTRDGGRPPEAGSQVQASNHCKLRPSKATVVSVAAKGGTRSRQVWSGEASESEPLMTCRNSMGDVKTGGAIFFRDQLGGGPEACLSGIRHIGGAKPDQALVWNVRTCRPDVKGEAQVAKTARA
jgi:Rhodopirellula transposase DDE domain